MLATILVHLTWEEGEGEQGCLEKGDMLVTSPPFPYPFRVNPYNASGQKGLQGKKHIILVGSFQNDLNTIFNAELLF